ncbi:MAG: PIN domain-containing protein [Candidatus Hydrogenedentes bacterium]|nr:PIN domain-containing protein [Candidatus Hydrogenedentota bacterium]
MNAVFADTSFFVAFLNPRDALHVASRDLMRNLSAPMITMYWVFAELGNFVSNTPQRTQFEGFVEALKNDPGVEILDADHASFDASLALYASRVDKQWSLTDCISFVVMDLRGIRAALTSDHHFRQAGYQTLLG